MTETLLEGFSEIGCRRCGKGGSWKVYTDGKGNFRAVHACGHISSFMIQTEPDPITVDMRFII
jgi:hypothetical protein